MARQQHLGRGKGMALQHSSISSSYIWLFVAASALLCCFPTSSAATVHTVGGDSGWSIMTPYSTWLQGKTFTVGDSLLFKYEQGWHDVTEVSKDGYDSCTGTGAGLVNKWTDGATTVALDKPGVRYFICSFIGHCPPMKLAVTVAADASSHSNSSTTHEAPSPAPTTTSSVQAPPPPPPPPPPPATTSWSPPPSTPSVPPTTSAAPPPSWTTTTTPPPSSPPHFHDEPSSWSPMPDRDHDDADTPDHSWSPTWAPSTPSWKPETPTWSPQVPPSSWSPPPPTSSWISPSSSNWGGPSIAPSEEPTSWISPSAPHSHPPIEEPSSWLTPSYVASPPQAVAEEPTSTSAPPPSMTTQPPMWTPTKAPTTAPSKAPSSSTRTPTSAPSKAPTTSSPPSGEPPAETPSLDVIEGVPPPASGPAVAESSFAHHHSPQFGALFLTVILALFFVNKL